jgi:hypothetical protein
MANDDMSATYQAFDDVQATFAVLSVIQASVQQWRTRRQAAQDLAERIRLDAEYGQLRREWTLAFQEYTSAQRRLKQVLQGAWQPG